MNLSDPAFEPSRTTSGAPLSPETAWCSIKALSGRALVTNSAEDRAAGSRFVAVTDGEGNRVGWWPSESWSDVEGAATVLSDLGRLLGDRVEHSDDFGAEHVVELAVGQLRFDTAGSFVRLTDDDGAPLGDGSAYWVTDEFAEDPEFVMGAVCGCACELTD